MAPLAVTAAVARAAQGDVDGALGHLHHLLALSDQLRLPDLVAAQRATLRIAYRFRLAKEHPSSLSLLVNAEDFGQAWMLEAMAPNSRPGVQAQSETGDSLEWAHHRWRTRGADADAGSFYEKYSPMVAASDAQSGMLAPRWLPIVLDLREAELISRGRVGSAAPLTLTANSWYQPTSDVPVDPAFIARLLLRASVLYNSGHKLTPRDRRAAFADLESRLGVRNLALLAFDEGDALALRLPRQALGLLRRAHGYFKQSKDHVGMLLSAARMALISAELGSREALAAQLKLVQWNWSAFLGGREQHEQQAPLPSWENLVDIAETLEAVMLKRLPSLDAAWRPWLFRIVMCLVRLRMLEGQALPTAAAFNGALSREYSAGLPGDLRGLQIATPANRPAETSKPTAVIKPSGPVSAPAWAPASTRLGRWRNRLPATLVGASFGVVAVAVAALILTDSNARVLVTKAIVDVTDMISYFSPPTVVGANGSVWASPYLFIPMLVVSLAVLLYYVLRLLSRLFRSDSTVIDVETISRSSDIELSRATFRAGVTFTLRSRPGADSIARVVMNVGGIGPYATMAGIETDSAGLNAVRVLWSHARTDIVMKVPDDLGSVCWEALLLANDGPPHNLRRKAHGFPARTMPAPVRDVAQVLVCAGDESGASVAGNGWTPQPRILSAIKTTPPSSPVTNVHVAHLIGRVEESHAGAVFEFGPSVAPLRAIDVRERFPAIHLCILQGAPLGRFDVRRDGTRRDANVARWFAHDLHARGVPAVLVIPPLETRHAAEALSLLAGLIGSSRRVDTITLMAAVAEIRTSILMTADLRRDDAWETASDVCLYCTDRWKLLR